MQLISGNNISKSYGTQVCFRSVDFQIDSRQRIGLIGANGTGKTTLLKMICGEEEYEGQISRRKELSVARLDQSPTFKSGATVRETLAEALAKAASIESQIAQLHEELAEVNSDEETERLLKRLADLEHRFELEGGHDAGRRIEAVLDGLGFPNDRHDEKIDNLSGGELNRVALARLLLNEPDLWLLDEPTNHLDLYGIEFLERFICATNAAAIIISHDRRFLDRLTTDTWEIESGDIEKYPGNYSNSRRLREERRESAAREYEKQQEYIKKQEDYIRRYKSGQRAREAKGRSKRLARLERLDLPGQQSRIAALDFSDSFPRLGNKVFNLNNVSMGYGDRVLFEKLSLEMEAGETLGIVGPNGTGKSTLLRLLLEQEKPLTGSVSRGSSVQHGVIFQHDVFPDESTTPFDFIRFCSGAGNNDQDVRDTLAAMLFRSGDVDKPVRFLSGGEKKRLMLTRLLMEGHNTLILDEPTNHLDVASCEALELALYAYPGSVLIVSHDRYFLDQIADRVLWLEGGKWRITRGGFSEAEEARQEEKKKTDAASARKTEAKKRSGVKADRPQNAYSKINLSVLERKIIEHEECVKEMETKFSDPEVYTDGDKMKEITGELEKVKAELEIMEEEYLSRG